MSSGTSSRPKRFVGKKTGKGKTTLGTASHQIPIQILEDPILNEAIKLLPANYSFEIHKTIHHIHKNNASMVALQMPEGLQMFACTIADIIEQFTDALTVIMGDVTYGACCVDDYTALALGCDMLVHYGHSCLVPIDTTRIKTLYVFVEIAVDPSHLVDTIRLNLPASRVAFHRKLLSDDENLKKIPAGTKIGPASPLRIESAEETSDQPDDEEETTLPTRVSLVSTVQFVATIQRLKDDLSVQNIDEKTAFEGDNQNETFSTQAATNLAQHATPYEVSIPRSKPLSPGEILGCTAPPLHNVDALIYVGDGRFHLESIMIANPDVPAFRYDPYSKKLTREWYDHEKMYAMRSQAIRGARETLGAFEAGSSRIQREENTPIWGVILGTLGRQGNFAQMQVCHLSGVFFWQHHIQTYRTREAIGRNLSAAGTIIPYVPILLSELSPAKLNLFEDHISTFIQTSCPRLSIDWGSAFSKPLLSPYETSVALQIRKGWIGDGLGGDGVYPMDFYAADSEAAAARKIKNDT